MWRHEDRQWRLGECNACEKVDDSRFWRWEESPIDEPPPSRAESEYSFRLNTSTYKVTQQATKGPAFGQAEMYRGEDTDLANFDFDAEIRIKFMKQTPDGIPRFTVTGSHDLFPAYEVYVNGQEAYVWGTADDLTGRPLDYAMNKAKDIVPREPRSVKILK